MMTAERAAVCAPVLPWGMSPTECFKHILLVYRLATYDSTPTVELPVPILSHLLQSATHQHTAQQVKLHSVAG
jgi:hypothetical protein